MVHLMPLKVPTYRPPHVGASLPVRKAEQRSDDAMTWARFIHGTTWRKLSKWYLSVNSVCVRCMALDILTRATQVHHTKGQDMDYAFDTETFEALCASCHSRQTATEMHSRGKACDRP